MSRNATPKLRPLEVLSAKTELVVRFRVGTFPPLEAAGDGFLFTPTTMVITVFGSRAKVVFTAPANGYRHWPLQAPFRLFGEYTAPPLPDWLRPVLRDFGYAGPFEEDPS